MTLTCEKNGVSVVKTVRDLILGDVWLCAGQSNIRVSFDKAKSGLMVARKEGMLPPVPTPDAAIQWLAIQSKDGSWLRADGRIDGSELMVLCKDIAEPVAVRYDYTQQPMGYLLYNKDGQPVGPFSTIGYGPELKTDAAGK